MVKDWWKNDFSSANKMRFSYILNQSWIQNQTRACLCVVWLELIKAEIGCSSLRSSFLSASVPGVHNWFSCMRLCSHRNKTGLDPQSILNISCCGNVCRNYRIARLQLDSIGISQACSSLLRFLSERRLELLEMTCSISLARFIKQFTKLAEGWSFCWCGLAGTTVQ